jgi:hypothetical protein
MSNISLPTLSELAAAAPTISVKCPSCARSGILPVAGLIERHGGDVLAVDLIARLSCSACGQKPVSAWIDYSCAVSGFDGYPR